jgi:hypothetical protein
MHSPWGQWTIGIDRRWSRIRSLDSSVCSVDVNLHRTDLAVVLVLTRVRHRQTHLPRIGKVLWLRVNAARHARAGTVFGQEYTLLVCAFMHGDGRSRTRVHKRAHTDACCGGWNTRSQTEHRDTCMHSSAGACAHPRKHSRHTRQQHSTARPHTSK